MANTIVNKNLACITKKNMKKIPINRIHFFKQSELAINFIICFMRKIIENGFQLYEVKTDEG